MSGEVGVFDLLGLRLNVPNNSQAVRLSGGVGDLAGQVNESKPVSMRGCMLSARLERQYDGYKIEFLGLV